MLWYPYAQMKTIKEPIHIKSAKGSYLYTNKNEKLIDSIASWWSVIHGYSNDEINKAMIEQINNFSHVMLGGLTHDPAKLLSEKLAEILPEDLDHVFFSDSGSVGVEVALKMAIQYHFNQGDPKKVGFISLKNSYHGDTFKTMQLGDDEDYHLAFPDKANITHINPSIEELKTVLENSAQNIAALVVEPLLQGAGGMRLYDVEFLIEAKKICNKYNVLLIFDEVATGFGRTGNMFVSNLVTPDIVILGKALTAGYIGHAATIANDKVFNSFYSDDPEKAFMHGPTFTGNPVCCAVALKSIEIFERDDYLARIAKISEHIKTRFATISSDAIESKRVLGAMGCIEVKDRKYLEGFSSFARSRGVWNRTFLNYVYIMPSYIITEEELEKVIDVFEEWFTNEI